MGILADPIRSPEVHAVREVRIEISLERFAESRRFYEDLLGLRPWPADARLPGTWGLGERRNGVLLMFRHDPAIDAARRRLTLIVPSFERIEQRLIDEKRDFIRIRGLGYADQSLLVPDPDGNLIELRRTVAL